MQRSINFTTSLLGPAIVVISGLVIPLIIAQNSIPGLLSNVSDLISNLDQRLHIAVVSAMLIFGVTFVVVYGWALRGLYHWLPRSNIALRPDSTPTLQQPFGWTLWRTTIAFVAIFAVVVLALTQVNYDLTTKTEQIDHLQITMPRFIDSLPIQNSVPTTFPPEDKDRSQQFVNDHSAYGALLWMGTLRPDPTTHISIPIGIWRNQPSSSLPETKIDQILQSTGPNISNVIRAKITNGDTVIDGVTYDITIPASDGSPANTDTVWMMVASTDPYSYIFAASGDKKSMVQAYLILNQMVNSIVIN